MRPSVSKRGCVCLSARPSVSAPIFQIVRPSDHPAVRSSVRQIIRLIVKPVFLNEIPIITISINNNDADNDNENDDDEYNSCDNRIECESMVLFSLFS